MNDIDWAWLFFSFEGRINRGKFWLGIVILWAVVWVLAMIAAAANSSFLWGLVAILSVVIIWPAIRIMTFATCCSPTARRRRVSTI